MYDSILLPLDGSSFAEEAVPLAGRLAEQFDSELTLAHVIRPIPDVDFKTPEEEMDWKSRLREAASSALSEITADLRADGVVARAEVLEGRVVDALLGAIDKNDVKLVVLTSHGSGGFRRWWLGSVADSLIRRSHRPVLLVRPWDETEDQPEDEGPRFHTILVPLDGSEVAERALDHARAMRDRMGGRIVLVRVVPSPLEVGSLYGVPSVRIAGESHQEHRDAAAAYLKEVAGRKPLQSAAADGAVDTRVVEASGAAEGVIESARVTGADLIVLASMGRGGFSRAVLGSVADKVIRGATPPVLVIPGPDDE